MIRFGILGAGNIAHRFADSLAHEEGAQLVAVSCRSAEKAAAWASERGLADGKAYSGADAHVRLLADLDVDAIYLALPHAFHHEWAISALRAGKAVLCEKPAMLSAEQMAEVAAVAREEGVLFMEAMKPRFQPLYAQVCEALNQIGDIVSVEASLCNDMLAYAEGKDSYHLHGGPGAGVVLDCGTYCASWLEAFAPSATTLTRVCGAAQGDVDVYADATFAGDNVTARLECAFDRAKPRMAAITGTKGSVLVEELHRPTRAIVQLHAGNETRVIEAPYEVDDFFGEIHHFCELLRSGATVSPVMSLDASVRCAALLDAVRAAFTPTQGTLDTIVEQERVLRYPLGFGAREALSLGLRTVQLAAEYDREVTIQIVRESDGMQLFGWSGDSKAPRNYDFIAGKRASALECGHPSVWPLLDARLSGSDVDLFADVPAKCPTAGAFPIRVGDEWVATYVVSGLHEGLDYELGIRALEAELGVAAPRLTTVVQ